MKQVIVIGTVHKENGLANVAELVAILEDIRPEVIFVEAPAGELDKFYSEVGPHLEASAVLRYSEGRATSVIPVDLPTPPSEFFREDRELNREIELRSPEYCRAADYHVQYTFSHGFHYLNSDLSISLAEELHSAMRDTLGILGRPDLDERYKLFRDTIRRRDEAMFTNVERFSSELSYFTGALLVGAAHRPGLMRLVQDRSTTEPQLIWQFASPQPDFSPPS